MGVLKGVYIYIYIYMVYGGIMSRVFYKALYTVFQMELYKLYAWYIGEKQGTLWGILYDIYRVFHKVFYESYSKECIF